MCSEEPVLCTVMRETFIGMYVLHVCGLVPFTAGNQQVISHLFGARTHQRLYF
jgi:hypothetical protein